MGSTQGIILMNILMCGIHVSSFNCCLLYRFKSSVESAERVESTTRQELADISTMVLNNIIPEMSSSRRIEYPWIRVRLLTAF